MPFWSGAKLDRCLPKLIHPFNRNMIDCAAYELRMGRQVYVSPSQHEEAPHEKTVQILEADPCFAIPPGQFALLITEEKVTVPHDAIAFISMKSKIKFNGLVNVSGFHVDPGYHGKILFAVFNAGPKPVHVKRGDRLLLIWYANLEDATDEAKYKKGDDVGHENIGSEYVNKINSPALSPESLKAKLDDVESEWQKYRADLEKYRADLEKYKSYLLLSGGAFVTWLLTNLTSWASGA